MGTTGGAALGGNRGLYRRATTTGGRDGHQERYGGPIQGDRAAAAGRPRPAGDCPRAQVLAQDRPRGAGWPAAVAGDPQGDAGPAVDVADRLAGGVVRPRPRPPAEVRLGGARPEPDRLPELLEAVLPQVPGAPAGDGHRAGLHARGAGRGGLGRRSGRVGGSAYRRTAARVGIRRWPRLQPAALCLGDRRHEEPQLARQPPADVRVLRRRAARDGAGLPEAGGPQVPPVRPRPQPDLRSARRALHDGGGAGAARPPARQGDRQRAGQDPDALPAVPVPAPAVHQPHADQRGARRVRHAHQRPAPHPVRGVAPPALRMPQ